ncbi:probable indole-3-acetic acid-amido synthetase GH3.8 isoform X2 [Asterias rubens]|uniref:probable indole-3-acetic acid-amido synthetase GH3.8 isoform X2 n=1 Tax=Asterias rubens TaxID=7604 RepID=UPI0014557F60|nr:probable indole-3-acetic acid-amido synthetase GH3.8 isoform X2 [Asterias rubens]
MAVTWTFRCSVWVMLSGFVTAYAANYCWASDVSWMIKTAICIFAGWCGLSTIVALHISTLRCSESHTLATLLIQYLMNQIPSLMASSVYSGIKKVWQRPMEEQEKFLMKLLARDAKTEYGMTHGFSDIKSLQEFREKHPLTKYEHYRDYFTRLADGEKNVCVAEEIHRFGTTSGTTGKSKVIPSKALSGVSNFVSFPRRLTKISPVQKSAILYCKPAMKFTATGLPIVPFFFTSEDDRRFTNVTVNSPFSAFQIITDFEATYVHMLFALTDKNIFQLVAAFASQVYRGLKMLEDEQEMFLEDLTLGRVNPKIQLDEGIRRSLDAALTADPARADELRREFAKGFVGIVGRIWPHLEFISAIEISGYLRKIEARYAKGTRFFTIAYGSTEGITAYNYFLNKKPPQYVLLPDQMVVEFIPEHLSGEENPDTLLMDEVEVGKRYEIVLTTTLGLYRYRLGDVIEIVGFHERCPVIAMRYRTGELLNLRSEKIDVLVVNNAVQDLLAGLKETSLIEWTCAESTLMYDDDCEYDMFYTLFVELESKSKIHLSAEQKSLFDKSLRKQHEFYEHYRHIGTICEARILVVRSGSFHRLQEFIMATSTASYNQFKMPKKLRTKKMVDFMLTNVDE